MCTRATFKPAGGWLNWCWIQIIKKMHFCCIWLKPRNRQLGCWGPGSELVWNLGSLFFYLWEGNSQVWGDAFYPGSRKPFLNIFSLIISKETGFYLAGASGVLFLFGVVFLERRMLWRVAFTFCSQGWAVFVDHLCTSAVTSCWWYFR